MWSFVHQFIIVVLVIIGVLSAIAMHGFWRGRKASGSVLGILAMAASAASFMLVGWMLA